MNSGDTAWVLASAALVLLMTPGLAFFYGGMVRAKSVLNMMMMTFVTIGIVSMLWVLYGFSVAFGDDGQRLHRAASAGRAWATALKTLADATAPAHRSRTLVFAAFQLMFAIITPALISGAIADRAKFVAWTVFVDHLGDARVLPGRALGVRLRHANGERRGLARAAAASRTSPVARRSTSTPVPPGLALCLVLGKRIGWPKDPMRPHNLPLVMLGAGLLWFGWFGFNAGSALAANGLAGLAFMNTQVATAAAAARLAHRGEDPRRARRPRSAAPPARSPAWSRSPRPARSSRRGRRSCSACVAGAVCALRGRAEVPARLRRLARRRRRAPGRRHRRLPAASASSAPPNGRRGIGRRRAVLRRRPRPAGQAGAAARLGARVLLRRRRSSSARCSTRRSGFRVTARTTRPGIDLDRARRDRVRLHAGRRWLPPGSGTHCRRTRRAGAHAKEVPA